MSVSLSKHPFPHVVIEDIFSPSASECLQTHLHRVRNEKVVGRTSVGQKHFSSPQSKRNAIGRLQFNIRSEGSKMRKELKLIREEVQYLKNFAKILDDKRVKENFLSLFSKPLSLRKPPVLVLRGNRFISRQILTVDKLNYEVEPHVDAAQKIVTIVIYLPEQDIPEFYDLGAVLLKPKLTVSKNEHNWTKFDVSRQIQYKPNVGFAFSACDASWHAVKKVNKIFERSRVSLQNYIYALPKKDVYKPGSCTEF